MKILLLGFKRKYGSLGKGFRFGWYEELFREELMRTPGVDVFPFGWGYTSEWMANKKQVWRAEEDLEGVDAIFSSFDYTNYRGFNKAKALKLHFALDFYKDAFNYGKSVYHYNYAKYDVSMGYGTLIVDHLKDNKVGKRQYHLPFGVDINVHRNLNLPKLFDVSAIFTSRTHKPVYPYRNLIKWKLKTRKDLNVYTNSVFYWDMVEKINQSKICVNCNAKLGFLNPRVTEVMACGTFLLNSRGEDFKKYGYKDGEHLVLFDNMADFEDKMDYFLKNDKEREEIAANGMKFVREHHSNQKRVERLLYIIGGHL